MNNIGSLRHHFTEPHHEHSKHNGSVSSCCQFIMLYDHRNALKNTENEEEIADKNGEAIGCSQCAQAHQEDVPDSALLEILGDQY